jgi:hypothetical protein
MKRFYGLTLVVALLIATGYLTMKPVKANSLAQSDCSQATLQGIYQFLAPATIVVSPGTVIAVPEAYLYRSPASFASQGNISFTGDGRAILEATADTRGTLAPSIIYDGTYTVNADCTAKVMLANGARVDVRMMQSGTQHRLVSATPGFVLIATN